MLIYKIIKRFFSYASLKSYAYSHTFPPPSGEIEGLYYRNTICLSLSKRIKIKSSTVKVINEEPP
jgi:hypothetical protein